MSDTLGDVTAPGPASPPPPQLGDGRSYRLLQTLRVSKLGARYFLRDAQAGDSPVVFVPTQEVRPLVAKLVSVIQEAMPADEGWPLARIADLFQKPAEQRSIPTLAKCGYLEIVPPDVGGEGGRGDSRLPTGIPVSVDGGVDGRPAAWSHPDASSVFDVNVRQHFFTRPTFFGIPDGYVDDDVHVGLFGVPRSSTHASIGTELAPDYLRLLTHGVGSWFDIHAHGMYTETSVVNGLPSVLGKGLLISDRGDIGTKARTIDQLMIEVRSVIEQVSQGGGMRPLFVGGDHAITFPVVHAFLEDMPDLALVHLDAHNDLFYADSVQYHHAAVVSNLLVYSGLETVHSFGVRTHLDPRTDTISGLDERLDGLEGRVHLHPVGPFRSLLRTPGAFEEVLRPLAGRPCYLSIDLDVLAPAELGGRLSTPVTGGLVWDELLDAVRRILKQLDVVGADVVELNPAAASGAQEEPRLPALLLLTMIEGLAESSRRPGV